MPKGYDEIFEVFLTPGDFPPVLPGLPGSVSRRLRDALEPIATFPAWTQSGAEASAALGLNFFQSYVWSRSAPLGSDVEPAVVASCFGVFSPRMIERALTSARGIASREAVLRAREESAVAGLSQAARAIPRATVESVGGQLLEALTNSSATGRPMFAALSALPVPTDPYGLLWRAADLYREHRGDGHLAAVVAAGVDGIQMNILTELWVGYPLGEYTATRGFSPEKIGHAADLLRRRGWLTGDSLSESGRQAREAIESATDASQAAVIDHLADRVEDVIASANEIADTLAAARLAPADARKRAAG